MKYKDLTFFGKFWYFLISPIIIAFIISLTVLVLCLTVVVKFLSWIGLINAIRAWLTVFGEGFAKKVKQHAGTGKDNQ